MADPFLGEIRTFTNTYAPYGWAASDGSTLNIQQYTALFSLIGSVFGGDGRVSFQLPNLSTRFTGGSGQGMGLSQRTLGSVYGDAAVTLVSSQMAAHMHTASVYTDGTRAPTPTATSALSYSDNTSAYLMLTSSPSTAIAPTSTVNPAGALPHENRQPMLAMMSCIALQGDYPNFP